MEERVINTENLFLNGFKTAPKKKKSKILLWTMLFGMWTSTVLCYIASFGWVPGVWILRADVLEHTVNSVFAGGTYLLRGNWQFPKRRHMKFRRRGITHKKEYNIQNTAKVWNQEALLCFKLPRFRSLVLLILLSTQGWVWNNGGIMTGKIMKYSHKNLSHCQLTTNNTRNSQVSNSCFRGKRLPPNSLSHGMTSLRKWIL